MHFSKFESLDKFLEFLLVNIKENQKIFGDSYLDMINKTS
jgi:hypothetical protein